MVRRSSRGALQLATFLKTSAALCPARRRGGRVSLGWPDAWSRRVPRTAKAEVVRHGHRLALGHAPRLVRSVVEVAVRILRLVVDGGRHVARGQHLGGDRRLDTAGRPQGVAHHGLCAGDEHLPGAVAERPLVRHRLKLVVVRGGRAWLGGGAQGIASRETGQWPGQEAAGGVRTVGVDVANVLRGCPRVRQRQIQALVEALACGPGEGGA